LTTTKEEVPFMEHVEFLAKVKAAKKHQREYIDDGVRIYLLLMLFGFVWFFLVPSLLPGHPYYLLIPATICIFGGLMNVHKSVESRKEFTKVFKEESDIIMEYDELLK
jgi:hypothetical protein